MEKNKSQSKKLSGLLLDESFVRFVKGTASYQETNQWSQWMQEKDSHKELVERARSLLDQGTCPLPKPDVEKEKRRLLKRIESSNKYRPLHGFRKGRKKVVWATMAAAAGILLLIGFLARNQFLQYQQSQSSEKKSIVYQTVDTDFGEQSTVRFSDGSEIVVNANSSMRLPEKTVGSDTMQVWLQGEAYFDIARKSQEDSRTFIVHTSDGKISVLGTQFAVKTNTDDGLTRTVLAEGKVRIDVDNAAQQSGIKYEMNPGEMALFSAQSESIKVSKVNPEVYTSWIGRTLILDATPLSELVKRIEFTYGLNVQVQQRKLLEERLTGKLKRVNLDLLLEGLSKALDVQIRRDGQTVYIKSSADESEKTTQKS